MRVDRWREWLDQGGRDSYRALRPEQCDRILNGIVHGVPVDFIGDRSAPRVGPNLPIEPAHALKVDAVIEGDVRALKKAGPFDSPPFANLAVSPIGAVPKKNSAKVRVIHHLSYPFHGDSVNAGIVEEGLSLSSFGHAARAVCQLGRGCFLIKLDVEAAYKQVPVRREDWPLLGFKWRGKWYYERVLPFGLRSSCRLWEMYATALEHLLDRALRVEGLPRSDRVIVHYVDDFLFVVRLASQARALLAGALELCADLGLPMAADKTEGPTQCLTFLGIELDTVAMEARLPAIKLAELKRLTGVWVGKGTASVAELQSLCGILNFACQVVRPGRFFLRRLISHCARIAKLDTGRLGRHAQFPLPSVALADMHWWHQFVETWNGHSLLYEADWAAAESIELFTDACNTGFGACYRDEWFCGAWRPEQLAAARRQKRISMPFLELHALVQAAATWGHQWARKKITFRCDCQPVEQALRKGSSAVPGLMHLLRHLCLLGALHGFDFRCVHIAGAHNVAADVLSRDGDCPQFRAARPTAAAQPTAPLPIPLPELAC